MKIRLLSLLLTFCMVSAGSAQEGKAAAAQDITVEMVGYEISHQDATAILKGLDVKVSPLVMIQQAVKAKAKVSKMATVKAKSGVRAAVLEKDGELDMVMDLLAVLGADGRTISVELTLLEGMEMGMSTALTLTDGAVVFLGALANDRTDTMRLVFIRAVPGK